MTSWESSWWFTIRDASYSGSHATRPNFLRLLRHPRNSRGNLLLPNLSLLPPNFSLPIFTPYRTNYPLFAYVCGIMATSRAPTSFEDLQGLLQDDIKVKVAGTTVYGWSRGYQIPSHSPNLGIDGKQTIELLQILRLLNLKLASSGWRSSRENYGTHFAVLSIFAPCNLFILMAVEKQVSTFCQVRWIWIL